MSDQRNSMLVRVAGIGAGLAAAWLVQKLLDAVWKRTSGHTTPGANDQDAPLAEVAVAVGLTAALAAVGRVLATRGTARAATRYLSR
jgi:F0F1-type ATP synthase membrane subunit c/vacuolar-type H+-ATPase subunit K